MEVFWWERHHLSVYYKGEVGREFANKYLEVSL